MKKLECCHADTCLPDYWSGHHLPHVQIAVWRGMTLAIQCEAPCGTIGTFLYSEKTDSGYALILHVMTDSVKLYQWAAANGWRNCSGPSPVGNYEKERA